MRSSQVRPRVGAGPTKKFRETAKVTGCGHAEVNGTYRVDGSRDGVPCFRREGGDGPSFTMERDSAPDQATQWCICIDYGFESWCFVDSESALPPATGWAVGECCAAPPPTLAAAGDGAPLPPAPVAAPEDEAADEAVEQALNGPLHVKKRHRTSMALSRGAKKKMRSMRRS